MLGTVPAAFPTVNSLKNQRCVEASYQQRGSDMNAEDGCMNSLNDGMVFNSWMPFESYTAIALLMNSTTSPLPVHRP